MFNDTTASSQQTFWFPLYNAIHKDMRETLYDPNKFLKVLKNYVIIEGENRWLHTFANHVYSIVHIHTFINTVTHIHTTTDAYTIKYAIKS